MRSKVLLYFLAVGMISGWAVNDGNAMNMQNLSPLQPLSPMAPKPVQPMQQVNKIQVQNVQQMKPMQSTQAGKGKKRKRKAQGVPQAKPTMPSMPQPIPMPTMQNAQGMPQAKPTMPTMPSVQQAKPTMPSMPQVQTPVVSKPLTAEDRFKQRIREMMKSGSTELVIDEDYLGLKDEKCENGNLPIIADDTEVANYIREKVKTLVVNSGTINIALESTRTWEEADLLQQEEQNRQSFVQQYLNGGQQTSYDQLFQKELERRQSSLNTKYNKYPLWFGALEHVILCNGSKVKVCQTNIQNRYDVTVKGESIDFCQYYGSRHVKVEYGPLIIIDGNRKIVSGMKKLYWWPNFGKYDAKDRSLELTSADEVKLLTDKIQTMTEQTKSSYKVRGLDISYMFSKITFPKNAIVDACVFDVCNTIAIDCQSTKLSWEHKLDDKQHNVIMNGVQFVSLSKKGLIETRFINEEMIYQLVNDKINDLKNSEKWNKFLKYHKQKYYSDIDDEYYKPSDYDVLEALDPELYDLMCKKYIKQRLFNFIWPEGCVLEKPDFTADDALLLARKAKLNVSDEIYIKDGIKWIGANSFSSSTKLPHNCFFNVTIPDSVIDIDLGAFSNGYIQDIIVRSERVKKLVQESGFQKNIIVDTNPQKRTRTKASKTDVSKPEAKHEISKHGNQQNELMESKRKISVLERRLMDTEQKLSEAEKKLADTDRELEYVKQKQQDADRKIAHLIGFLNGKYGFDPDYCYDNY